MHSFKLIAVGNLGRNPELIAKGDSLYTRLCLIGNDYAGRDEEGSSREVTTCIWFTAFDVLGETLAKHTLKGDQLILEARVQSNNWTDGQGQNHYDYSFVVTGFRFGAPGPARREIFDSSGEVGD